MKYHISVTADDILKGRRSSAHYCPIARAATRTILGKEIHDDSIFAADRVSVAAEVRVYRGGFLVQGVLPQSAHDFINKFDSHEAVEPFEFDLEFDLELV